MHAWVTTAQVAQAAGISAGTVLRWSKLGVMPAPQIHFGGARGRVARWPMHAPEQARWVLAKLEARYSWGEIREALERGEFIASH